MHPNDIGPLGLKEGITIPAMLPFQLDLMTLVITTFVYTHKTAKRLRKYG